MTTLFISDLHLTQARPAVTDLFLAFLRGEARRAEALYILGDFFEYWVGDDAIEQAEYRPVVIGLRALVDSGVPVFLMHGNRDFLLGDRFERETGGKIIADPTCIDLYGTRVLLMHGDALCTDDLEHQQFRRMFLDDNWRRAVLAKPLAERQAMARNYREMSRESAKEKALEIMDVTQHAVEATMREHGVRHLIHGHTHRPATHDFMLDAQPAQRIVLGDWYDQGSVLRCTRERWKLTTLPLASLTT